MEDTGEVTEDRRYHRPVLFEPRIVDDLPGGFDPTLRDEVAHATANLLVYQARGTQDPQVVDRLVRLVETEGLDVVAALWSDAAADSLPGALWRLYVLREWVRRDPATVGLRYRLGVEGAPVHEVIAGVVNPPEPADLQRMAEEVLSGVYAGDLAVALERAASFGRILVTGAAFDADSRDAHDPSSAAAMTRGASSLLRTAEELEHAAALWRAGRLE